MATIVTRAGKGSPLTNNEVDANFVNLNTELVGKVATIASTDGSVTVTGTTAIDLSVAVAGATSNVLLPVRNTTGATLTKGTAVYISGATGQLSTVSKAIATSDATSAQTLGLMTADLANNSNGNVTLIGSITNINTSAYSDGQQLYLSPTTAGTLTGTKPYAPQHLVYVAIVEHAHPTQGKLFVKIQNGYELDELHDVVAQTPTNGQTLVFNSTTNLWEKNTVSLTAGVNGTLPVAKGGSGQTTYTNGQLLIGNSTGNTLSKATLTAGTNVTITNGPGTITISASGGGGGSTPTVGQVVQSAVAPSTGTWLQTNKYYSKATYPALAAALGDVPDIGSPVVASKAQLPVNTTFNNATRAQYSMATSGSAWVIASYSPGKFVHTTNGADFSTVPPNATITNITGVWYANGLYLATTTPLNTASSLLVSSDGLSWSSCDLRPSGGSTEAAWSVAYGAGVYVISHQLGVFYTSDLSTFTQAASVPTGNYTKVIYANSQFVVVGNNVIYTSPDGITWTSRTSPANTNYQDVIYANSLYVAYGNYSTGNLATSTDGATWATRSVGTGNISQVIYGGGQFVAAGTTGVYTSPNGTTWTAATTGILLASSITSVAYIGGTYYVGTNSSGYYATSTDGAAWALKRDASSSTIYAFHNVNGAVAAVGNPGIIILSGGTREAQQPTFTFGAFATTNGGRQVAYNGSNQFVAVSSGGLPFSSSDGQNWVGRPLNPTSVMAGSACIAYLNGTYIIFGSGSGTGIYTSTDGLTWQGRTTTVVGQAAAFGASAYVVVGTGGSITSSANATTWTTRSGTGTNAFNDVTFGNGVFVAVGAVGACYSSPDGTTWTSRSAGANDFNRVIYVAGSINLFIAVGAVGGIYTSPDGATWTSRSVGGGTLNDIVYNSTSGLLVAVGTAGTIQTSSNGTAWTTRTLGDTTYNLSMVTWDGTRFFTAPQSNAASAAFRSSDGITWTRTYMPANTARLQWIGGQYVLLGTSTASTIHYSSDSLTWYRSPQNSLRTTANLTALQKVGGVYFTSSGFTSTDGITFTPSRSLYTAMVAYDGTYYYTSLKGAGSSHVIYRSSDGNAWSYLTELGTDASTTRTATAFADMLYANGKLVAYTAGYVFATSTDATSVFYSTDGITWTPGNFPAGGYPGTTSVTGFGAMATDGTTLLAAATTTSVAYGMYKSTDSGATWTSVLASSFAPIIYTGGYWNWQSYKSADGSNIIAAPTNAFTAVGSYNGYTFNIFGTSAAIWETSANASTPLFTYKISLPGAFGLAANAKETPVRTSDKRALTIANITSLGGTMSNPIAEYPLFSYDTTTTFYVPQQVVGLASNEYIYAGA
jgi:hypothetical protein